MYIKLRLKLRLIYGLAIAGTICLAMALLPNIDKSNGVAMAQTVAPEEQKAEADRLLEQGTQQYNNNQIKEAVQSFQQALEQYRALGDRVGESRSLMGLGDALILQSDYPQVLRYYEQALAIAEELRSYDGQIFVLQSMGLAASASGNPGQALELLQRAEGILQAHFPAGALRRQFEEAKLLLVKGGIYQRQGNPQQAIQTLQQGLTIVRNPIFIEELDKISPDAEAARRGIESTMLGSIAQSYADTGQARAAIEALEEALTSNSKFKKSRRSLRFEGMESHRA
jgi:tetratricopeptide (TPR) repeat protein